LRSEKEVAANRSRICKVDIIPEALSEDEQIILAVSGVPLNELPTKRARKVVTKYRIDKVIVFKDIFIIKNLETEVCYRYKMNKSSIFFLKKLRNKVKPMSLEEAGDMFFRSSVLLNEIVPKPDEDDSDSQTNI